MRIIESFICYHSEESMFVKVHKCRDIYAIEKYYIEDVNGLIKPITIQFFESIKQ